MVFQKVLKINFVTWSKDGKHLALSIRQDQMKGRRDKVLEVVRQSIPNNGCGRVLRLVKAFENALAITKSKTDEEAEDETIKVPKWELLGLRPKTPVTEFSSPDLFLSPKSLGLDSQCS